MNLSDVAIRRPVFTTMMMVALMVLGTVAYRRLGVELFPDVSFPIVVVTTPYPGAGPNEMEQLVTRPVEDAVASLGGVESVRSFSRESVSTVVVAFEIGTDIDTATLDVRDRVTVARRGMPDDVEEPNYLRIDPSASPVITLVLSGDADPRDVRQLAEDQLKPILEQVDGVATVNVRGGVTREIQVNLEAQALNHYRVAPAQVVGALAYENLDVPAGRLDGERTETSLRLRGQFSGVHEINRIAVADANGQIVRVEDVGEVVDGSQERRTYVRVNGQEAVSLDIVKQAGANTVAVADNLYEAIERARAKVPPGMSLGVIVDSSVFIRENANHVLQELILGGLAAIAVIFLFMLDWRSTLISALALPTSIVATFFAIWMLGYTLNTMTLLGLSLSIGFLIDDAIVVRENIYRHLEMGEPPMEAASKGTKEIALAVLATTASILAVFIPVAFTEGLIGRLFRQFAITVAVAVAFSLFVAFTVDPMLSARLVKPHDPNHNEHAGVLGAVRRTMEALDPWYRGLLEWALRRPILVVMGATLSFFASFGLIGLMGTEFFPKPDRGQFTVAVTYAPGTSLEENLRRTQQIEQVLLADKDVDLVYTVVGRDEEARKSTLRVDAGPKEGRERDLMAMMAEFRAQLGGMPGVTLNFQEAAIFEGDLDAREAPVAILIRGPDYAVLEGLAGRVEQVVLDTKGTADVSSTLTPGLPELSLRVDRDRAAALGVSAAQLGMTLRTLMVGEEATRLREGEDDFPVRVRLRAEDRADVESLAAAPIGTRMGLFPLREFTTIEQTEGPATIEREDRQRQVSISANVVGRSLGEVVGEIQEGLDALEVPPGYTVAFGGEAERMRESGMALLAALVLAIIFIYVVLASQFESFLHPITIMVSLPLAVVGAFLGLFLAGKVLGMSAMIGVILLMGLVTKNAILLVDYANQLRDEQGLELVEAMLVAGPTRLRPILMTSATIVLGSLPTALSTGPGSEFRSPMSMAVIGGVITSTLLTLVVVPVVYRYLDGFTARGRAERARRASA